MSERYNLFTREHDWPGSGTFLTGLERYEGDGLDFRRPVMSTSATTQTGDENVIDLTADDSIDPSPQPEASEGPFTLRNRRRTAEEGWNEATEVRRSTSRRREERARQRNLEREATLARIQYARDHAPRFGRDIIGDDVDELEVIDLLDSDDTAEAEAEQTRDQEEDLFGDPIDRSPEITFLSERPAPVVPGEVPSRNNHRRLPTPQNHRGGVLPNTFQNLRDYVRQGTLGYRGLSENEMDDAREAIDRETLDRIDGIREARPNQRNRERFTREPFGYLHPILPSRQASIGIPDYIDLEDIDMDMTLDYENAAFQVGDPDHLEVIEPPEWPATNAGRDDTPIELDKEPYSRPKAPAKGFTLNFAAEDVLNCPNCHEELAVGTEGSTKEQVWLIKSCGHVSWPTSISSNKADDLSRSTAANAPVTAQPQSRRRRKPRWCRQTLYRSRSAWCQGAGRAWSARRRCSRSTCRDALGGMLISGADTR